MLCFTIVPFQLGTMGLFVVRHLIHLATCRGMPGLDQIADNLKNNAINIFLFIESSVAVSVKKLHFNESKNIMNKFFLMERLTLG